MGLTVKIETPYIVHFDDLKSSISSAALMGNHKPLNLEIGSGKGRFLYVSAGNFPDENFIGLEKTPKCLHVFREKVEPLNLDNVRIVHCFLDQILDSHVPDGSVQNVCVFFPDPWPKKRHRKRRFMSVANLMILWRKLVKDGELLFKTDFEDYYMEVVERLSHLDQFMVIGHGIASNWKHRFNVKTHFEMKYVKVGKPIYYLHAKKIQECPS